MDQQFSELIAQYGLVAVFFLCTVEGDITLLLSGTMAHGALFGKWSFLKVFLAGTLGGIVGDSASYGVGRFFRENAKDYKFYQMAKPRVDKLVDKFGPWAIIVSKYVYGLRVAICLSYGVSQMPFLRFLTLSAISCSIWVFVLTCIGFFFSGAIKSIIGDWEQVGIFLFIVVLLGIIVFFVIERYWISEKVEDASPETIHKIEEKLHAVEEVGKNTLHDVAERLHLTREPNRDDVEKIGRADKER
jgi:membrane-associated protein